MEAGAVRVVLLCLALMVAPVAAASPEDGSQEGPPADQGSADAHGADAQGQDGGGHGDDGQGDDSQGDDSQGDDSQGDDGQNESIDLTVNPEHAGNRLDWAFHGKRDRVQSFDVYRSINEGPAQLIGSLSKNDKTFVDDDLQESGTYHYLVTATHTDGSQTESNGQFVGVLGESQTCTWVSVSPFGKPPVLFNDDCSPINIPVIIFLEH